MIRLSEDFLVELTNTMVNRMSAEMEKVIINFLKDNGFEIGEDVVGSIMAIQEELIESNRQLRCEYFMKFNDDGYSFTGLCIPFIDALDKPITRAEVYTLCRLQEQGYSYKGEKVWL